MAGEIVKTNIDGLVIRINKVIGDVRGVLCELAPKGLEDEMLSAGVKNVYASMPTQRGIARGGHYHLRQIENLYTLAGTVLWVFCDMRGDSKTKGNVFPVILGWQKPPDEKGVQVLTIDQNKMAQVMVPPGVYHIFAPLTEEKAVVLNLASRAYDKTDYAYPELSSLPEVKKVLDSFGVSII